MSLSSSSIKKLSLKYLKQNYMSFFIAAIIIIAVGFLISNFASIVGIFTESFAFYIVSFVFGFLFLIPLLFGFLRFSWRIISNVHDKPISIFYYFSDKNQYLRVIRLVGVLLVRAVACFLIFYIPVLVFNAITSTWFYSFLKIPIPIWTFNLSNIGTFLKLLSVTATFFSIIKFYLSPMLFVADENMDIAEAIHMSSVISKRTTLDFVFLSVSFLGWILLSYLAIPLIFTLPYMTLAYLIHSVSAVDAFNIEISRTSLDDIPTFIAGA